ncbi:zinc uptake protein ZrgA [Photobacterium sp. DNB22_13_2]
MLFNQSLSPVAALFVSLGLSVSISVSAEDHFRQHDAHLHGVVEVNIAQDGQDLLMEIHAPGADIVGFEHAPQTDEQKTAIIDAIKQLKAPESLWVLTANAKCQLVESVATETLTSQEAENHKGHDDHDSHDHDDHGHDHDSHDHGAHGEFSAQYTYKCSDINQLTEVKTQWFTHYPSTERITVNTITEKGQKGGSLTSNAITFRF